jgi:hypothetical protein
MYLKLQLLISSWGNERDPFSVNKLRSEYWIRNGVVKLATNTGDNDFMDPLAKKSRDYGHLRRE